jgi:pyruvate ferredoxin oxidoreductase gamma subunit
LDESLYHESLHNKLKPGGKLILNTSKEKSNSEIISFDANKVAQEYLGVPITNTAMLTVLVANTQLVSKDSLLAAIQYDMPERIASKNQKLVEYIFTYTKGVRL